MTSQARAAWSAAVMPAVVVPAAIGTELAADVRARLERAGYARYPRIDRGSYDVIDAPPLLRAESQAVLRQADGALLVVRAGATDEAVLSESWRERSAGIRWLGAVLTQAESGAETRS